jgi:hypothetical protein
MKLLSVSLARSVWLIPYLDLNPIGKSFNPMIIWVGESYKFRTIPSFTEKPNLEKGLKFEHGEFKTKSDELIEVALTVYADGVMAESRSSTKDTDEFLEDISNGLSNTFGLPDTNEVIRKKAYFSQLYVRTEKSFNTISSKLEKISTFISQNIKGYEDAEYQMGGFYFWPEQNKSINPPLFTLERALNTPFSENRYFSTSGLETDKHLEALEKIESILLT